MIPTVGTELLEKASTRVVELRASNRTVIFSAGAEEVVANNSEVKYRAFPESRIGSENTYALKIMIHIFFLIQTYTTYFIYSGFYRRQRNGL